MADLSTQANRFYPSIPSVTENSATHTNALQQIRESIETHERRNNNYLKSFVRFEELVDLGIISATGENLLTDLTGGGAVATNLGDLNDVTLTSPIDNDFLGYDVGTGEWINQTASQMGVTEIGHTHVSADITDLSAVQELNDLTDVDTFGSTPYDLLYKRLSDGDWVPTLGLLQWDGADLHMVTGDLRFYGVGDAVEQSIQQNQPSSGDLRIQVPAGDLVSQPGGDVMLSPGGQVKVDDANVFMDISRAVRWYTSSGQTTSLAFLQLNTAAIGSDPDPVTDPDLASVTCLVTGETAAAGAVNFTSDIGGHLFAAETASGGVAEVSSAQSRFGNNSIRVDDAAGVVNAVFNAPQSTDFNFDAGDFTVEFHWRTPEQNSTLRDTIGKWVFGQRVWRVTISSQTIGDFRMTFNYSTTGSNIGSGTGGQKAWVGALDTWYHIAIVRDGNDLHYFVDGVLIDTDDVTGETFFSGNSQFSLGGADGAAGGAYELFLDNVRITKGVARYTSGFTPPAAPFEGSATDISFDVGDPTVSTLIDGTDVTVDAPLTITDALVDLDNSLTAANTIIRARNSAGGVTLEVDVTTGNSRLQQTDSAGAPEDILLGFTRNAQTTFYHNNVGKAATSINGFDISGALYMVNQASIPGVPGAGSGAYWVNTSDRPQFTNDSGVDFDLLDHTDFTNIGTNTHAQIDTHIADATIHFTEASIDHLNIQNIGTNTHAQIDTHIADATIHFTEGSIDHANILNIGTNSHAAIDTHIADATIHFTQAAISITESQISDLQDYILEADATVNPTGDWRFNVETIGDFRIDRQSATGASGMAFDNDDGVKGYIGYDDLERFTLWDVATSPRLQVIMDDAATLSFSTNRPRFDFLEDVRVQGSVSATTSAPNTGINEQIVFMDVNGGVGRFGSYNWSLAAWQPTSYSGSTILIASQTGDITMTSAGGNLLAGTVDADFDAITATSYGGILEADLLDKSADETVSGSWTFTNGNPVILESAQPDLFFRETDAAADEGNWMLRANGGNFNISTATDASPSAQVETAIVIARTGTVVNTVDLGNYSFDVDQAVGAGQDNFVLTYDDASGLISLEAAAGGSGITELTGDVTAGPGSGSQAATIANDAVTNLKLANMAANTVKARTTGAGDPQDLLIGTDRILGNTTASGVLTALDGSQVNVMLPAFTSGLKGLTPASGGGTTNFLRADGTWAAPTATPNNTYVRKSSGTQTNATTVFATATNYSGISLDAGVYKFSGQIRMSRTNTSNPVQLRWTDTTFRTSPPSVDIDSSRSRVELRYIDSSGNPQIALLVGDQTSGASLTLSTSQAASWVFIEGILTVNSSTTFDFEVRTSNAATSIRVDDGGTIVFEKISSSTVTTSGTYLS